MSGGEGGKGKREKTERRRAPGPGDGGLIGGEQAPTVPPGGTGWRPGSGGGIDPTRSRSSTHQELDSLAPLHDPPAIYPPLAKVYRLPITFEVELVDEAFPPTPGQAAHLGRQEEPTS